MAKTFLPHNDNQGGGRAARPPTKQELNAANEAVFGPPKAKPARQPRPKRPSGDTPMVRRVRRMEQQSAMY